jgi:hypothetical protein
MQDAVSQVVLCVCQLPESPRTFQSSVTDTSICQQAITNHVLSVSDLFAGLDPGVNGANRIRCRSPWWWLHSSRQTARRGDMDGGEAWQGRMCERRGCVGVGGGEGRVDGLLC